MKTYSVCFYNGSDWITNWNQYGELSDIDWDKVLDHCVQHSLTKYGYIYGHRSARQVSDTNRVIMGVV